MLKANWLKLIGVAILFWILSSMYAFLCFGGLYLMYRFDVPLFAYLPYLWLILVPPTVVAWLLYTRIIHLFYRHGEEDKVLMRHLDDKEREIVQLKEDLRIASNVATVS